MGPCCRPNPYALDTSPACPKGSFREPPPPPLPPLRLRGPTGPPSPYQPSFFFQAVLAKDQAAEGTVGFDLVTTGNDDMAFDAGRGAFVAPALGFYQFYFSVTCAVTSSQNVHVELVVNDAVLYSSSTGSPANQVQTISGSALVQLLPDQLVTIRASTPSGGGLLVKGPATPGAPPYPTLFSGFSFL